MMRILKGMVALVLIAASHTVRAAISCTVVGTGISFPNYSSPGATAATGMGNVAVTCKATGAAAVVNYTIALSKGSGTFVTRTLKSGSNVLNYNIYTTSGLTAVWGDATGSTDVQSDSYLVLVTSSTTRNYIPYGNIPGGQNARAGTYTDAITVTVRY